MSYQLCVLAVFLEAKIDSERNRVEIATQTHSSYQQVLDKTRNILARTNILVQHLEKPGGNQQVAITRNNQAGDFGQFRQRTGQRGGISNYPFSGDFGGKRIR